MADLTDQDLSAVEEKLNQCVEEQLKGFKVEKYLDSKFDDFKAGFLKKLRLPVVLMAAGFAALVSVFAIYLYAQARINVMKSLEDLSKAKITFYEGMTKANNEIRTIRENFIQLSEKALLSVDRMKKAEDEFDELLGKKGELESLIDRIEKLTEVQEDSIKDRKKVIHKKKAAKKMSVMEEKEEPTHNEPMFMLEEDKVPLSENDVPPPNVMSPQDVKDPVILQIPIQSNNDDFFSVDQGKKE